MIKRFTYTPNTTPGIFTFWIGSYDVDQIREWHQSLKISDKHGFLGDPPNPDWNAACYGPEPLAPFVWLKEEPLTPRQIASLVHELEHAVMRYFDGVGLVHGHTTTEVYAYMIDRLVSGVLSKVWHDISEPGIGHWEELPRPLSDA